MAGRVHRKVAVLDRPAEDHAEWHQDVAYRRRVEALAEKLVAEALDIVALDLSQPLRAEFGENPVAKGALVAADRAWLVDVPGLGAHLSGTHPGDELLGRFGHRRCRRRTKLAATDGRLSFRSPGSRGCESGERLAQPLPVARAPRARLVRRPAVALAPSV